MNNEVLILLYLRASPCDRARLHLAFPTQIRDPPKREIVEVLAGDDYPIPIVTKKTGLYLANKTINEHTNCMDIQSMRSYYLSWLLISRWRLDDEFEIRDPTEPADPVSTLLYM